MFFKKKRTRLFLKEKRKPWMIVFPITSIFIAISVWGAIAFFIPDEINLMEGEEQSFRFHLPLQAEVQNDNINVLNVNNQAVTDNIHIDLNEPFTVKSENQGNAKVSLSLFGLVPVKTVSATVLPKTEVIPGGMAVGISMDTKGIMVLGTGFVTNAKNETSEPSKNILKSGDLILEVNKTSLDSKEDLIQELKKNGDKPANLLVNRNNKQEEIAITPVWSAPDNCYKIGIWVRDSAQGIGTITYYNPYSDKFGALGHGVYDIDTKELMNIKGGVITHSNISEVKKGEKGVPGELLGTSEKSQVLGEIKINTDVGLYGKINENKKKYFSNEPVSIAMQTEIQEGPATILTNISGDQIESYEVQIESVNHYSKNDSKGMVIKITDKNLLTKTGGIVQGMSGSPIMQNGKLIGAITHVFVQDPTKGYGIFIENMLKEEEKAVA